jgi:regulator of RNase E activity RraA
MLDEAVVNALGGYSAPSIFNGLKWLGVSVDQLESVGRHAARCMAPALGPRIGFAVTRRVATRSSGPPADADRTTRQGALIDAQIMGLPAPRFLVVENIGDHAGRMCIWGELAATINVAMGCVAGLTNGPVRDLPEMEAVGFLSFAGGVATGGGHVDAIDVGTPVSIGGITIETGDLLLGDRHGVVKIPIELAARLPEAIRAVDEREARIIAYCKSADFSAAGLAAMR